MARFGGVRTPFVPAIVPAMVGAGLIAVVLAGCSSSNKATPPTQTSTSSTTSSSTTVAGTSTSTPTSAPPNASTTNASTAPATTARPSVRITGFAISPSTPVCNSPTMIQVTWTATGATSVDLSIDGSKFASYPGGAQSHLEYFACDGRSHTYLLTARGASGTATASKVVSSTSTG